MRGTAAPWFWLRQNHGPAAGSEARAASAPSKMFVVFDRHNACDRALRFDEVAVLVGAAVAEKLPDAANLFDGVEVCVGDDELVVGFAADG